jgi:hypothetical protein
MEFNNPRERPAVKNLFETDLKAEIVEQPARNQKFQHLSTQIRSLMTHNAAKNDGFIPIVAAEQERVKAEKAPGDKDDSKTIIDQYLMKTDPSPEESDAAYSKLV